MKHISTHILDTSLGRPAAQVQVSLHKKTEERWELIETLSTNSDGRVVFTKALNPGDFKIIFQTEKYYTQMGKKIGTDFFFNDPEVSFRIEDEGRNYHVPLLLNPFGFSTYRGS
jgi:5-hydroxyisourate hydrolase